MLFRSDEEHLQKRMSDSRSRRFSTLENILVFLFVAMTGACIGLVVIYFTDKTEPSTVGEFALVGLSGKNTSTVDGEYLLFVLGLVFRAL